MTTTVRQEAAHEARFAILTERNDEEMRDYLDQAGLRLQAAEAQIQASGNMSGHVMFTLSKGDDARQLQRHGSHEILRLKLQDVELRHLGVGRARTRGCS